MAFFVCFLPEQFVEKIPSSLSSSLIILPIQNGFHFPGTRERVALIVGAGENVLKAAIDLVERIAAVAPPAGGSQNATVSGHSRGNAVLLAIPAFTAGTVLGKGGENIKAVQAETGVSMRVSPKVCASLGAIIELCIAYSWP